MIEATNVPPITNFRCDEVSDALVLAGRNGVGKTRLVAAIIQVLQAPREGGNIRLEIEATTREEQEQWQTDILDTHNPGDPQKLLSTLQAVRTRRHWKSSILQFESDRSIQRLRPYTFTWDVGDPWGENVGWDRTFGFLRDRFEDTVHSLFRRVQSRRNQISRRAEELMLEGVATMELNFPDPVIAFKEAFSLLLSPKRLLDPDPRDQVLKYEYEGQQFNFDTLSSGEREVVNIVFDFLLRNPSDCIVFFDEPELHLHPELSYKLLRALQTVAGRNQFIYCTHSPDIITASLDQSVVFIGPPTPDGTNQAIPVSETDDTNQALRLLGHSIGIIALGKRIVLVEGHNTSLDKQLYGSIIAERFPELVLVASEGREVIASFNVLNERVLQRALWGVEFFMLCDRDAVPPITDVASLEAESHHRLRVLPRYHVENYLLDHNILASVFEDLEPADSWLRNPDAIQERLQRIAAERLSHAVALYVSSQIRQQVGNIDIMPADCHGIDQQALGGLVIARTAAERNRVQGTMDDRHVQHNVDEAWVLLEASLANGTWISLFPGRPIFNILASETTLEPGRLKRAYLHAAYRADFDCFADILQIFGEFAATAP